MTRALKNLSFVFAVNLLCAFGLGAANEALDWQAPLPVDPNIRMGRLANGVSYWIRRHATPPGKVGIWLHVASGSLNEDDDQRGLAHFIEHLAFNGTANFPPGTVVKYFESIGLRFGQHQNAFTSFNQTTYMIHLPDTREATLTQGLLCLADFGFRQSLLPEEIEKERKVILEEMRARKGVSQRLMEKMLPLILPGSRVAERLPIGTEEVVRAADLVRFKAYYGRWYRPELATVLLVGDISPAAAEKLIAEQFGEWKREGPAAALPSPGVRPYTQTRAATITDPELSLAECMVVRVQPLRELRTFGDFRRRLLEELGCWILDRRFADLVRKGAAPFQSADVNVSTFLNTCTTAGANATGKPDQWAPMMRALLAELKRAREHGFLEQEFEDARKALLAGAEQAARTESTWDARAFLSRMNSALAQERKPMSELQRLELLARILPTLKPDQVNASFRADFAPDARLLLVTLPEKQDLAVPSEDQVLALAREAEAAAVAAPAAKARARSLLEAEPPRGAIDHSGLDRDLEILSVTFDNGVRVHMRSMDFKKNQVLVRLMLAGGTLHETADQRAAAELAALAFDQPATDKLSSIEIRDLLTGRNVSLSGWAGEDALHLRLSAPPQDLEEGFRLLHLVLTAGRIEASALKVWREQQQQEIESRRRSVEAQLSDRLSALLSGGDPRFAFPTAEQLAALTLDAGRRFLDEHLGGAPIEGAIVGDLPLEQMLELARRYLASLPPRPKRDSSLDRLRKLSLSRGPQAEQVEVDSITPRATVTLGWRGADWKDVKNRRLLQIGAMILNSRLREEIREKRGLTYTISAAASAARAYPGTGLLAAYFTADPQKAGEAADLVRRLAERFAAEGPTAEEMDNTRKQLRNMLETQLKEPSYWVDVLSDLDYRGTKLSDVKEVLERMIGYSQDDVRGALKKFVKEERRLQVIALPKPGAKP